MHKMIQLLQEMTIFHIFLATIYIFLYLEGKYVYQQCVFK